MSGERPASGSAAGGHDVLIVGGGLGGAVLAGLLARTSLRVLVLERGTGRIETPRPEVLWPATIDALSSLVPRKTLEEEATLPVSGLQVQSGHRALLSFSFDTPVPGEPRPCSTDPGRTRELLLDSGGFEVRRGIEVLGVLKDGDGIVGVRARETQGSDGEIELLASCVVGDDGPASRVRAGCGVPMTTQPFPREFLSFGFEWPSSLPSRTGRAWLNLRGTGPGISGLLAVPLPKGRGVGLVFVRPEVFEVGRANTRSEGRGPERTDENPGTSGEREPGLQAHGAPSARQKATAGAPATQSAIEEWERFRSCDPVIALITGNRAFPEEFAHIRRAWGHAPSYGGAGAFLIGDAIHPVSPAGGQGANMSVADSLALADILGRPGSSVSPHWRRQSEPRDRERSALRDRELSEYSRRRRPANRRSLMFTRITAGVLSMPPWFFPAPLVEALVKWVYPNLGLPRYILSLASTAFQERPRH